MIVTDEINRLLQHCACPGDILTYECTVVGEPRGVTLWNGTALNICPGNRIIFVNGLFSSIYGAKHECDNGSIVARSLPVEGDNYTSQLNVTVTSYTAGKTIKCFSYNSNAIHLSTVIPTPGLSSIMYTKAM